MTSLIKKTCPICKKTFECRPDRGTYCSPSCSGKGRWAKNQNSKPLKVYGKTKYCSRCGIEKLTSCFSKRTSHLLQSNCIECRSSSRKKGVYIPHKRKPVPHIYCSKCKSLFRPKSTDQKYCSKRCAFIAPEGYIKTATKYPLIKIKDGNQLKWKRLSHYVVEKHIGRPIKSIEVIHHKDKNPHNNDIANLEVLTPAGHCRLHHLGIKHKANKHRS